MTWEENGDVEPFSIDTLFRLCPPNDLQVAHPSIHRHRLCVYLEVP